MYFTIPSRPLTGPEKVGALMIALGPERSAAILSRLAPEEVERVISRVATMQGIDWETRETVLESFRTDYEAGQGVTVGGVDYAEALLGKALGPEQASKLAERLRADQEPEDTSGLSFLPAASAEQLEAALAEEHPQTIAVVLAHAPADKAAQVLGRLERPLQLEVARRLAEGVRISHELVVEMDRALQAKAATVRRRRTHTGPQTLAGLLCMADRTTERGVLESLEPALAEQVRRNMFLFEDLPKLDERDLQVVLREAGSQDLALALRGVPEALSELVFRNISERAAAAVQEDIELQQRVRPGEVEAAQQRICALVRQMINSGEIVLPEAQHD